MTLKKIVLAALLLSSLNAFAHVECEDVEAVDRAMADQIELAESYGERLCQSIGYQGFKWCKTATREIVAKAAKEERNSCPDPYRGDQLFDYPMRDLVEAICAHGSSELGNGFQECFLEAGKIMDEVVSRWSALGDSFGVESHYYDDVNKCYGYGTIESTKKITECLSWVF